MSRARDLGDVGSKANFLDNVSTDLGDFSGQSIPHIIPDVLYPAVEGKDLAGVAFSGSYVYGTAHTDGRKYYYTDIKGSKPIKDPRIGGHFGSQRHRVSSTQLLEQETATQGNPVYSIDGREWMRAVETVGTQGDAFFEVNNDDGHRFQLGNGSAQQAFVEITGYFSDVNILGAGIASTQTVTTQIDGATAVSNNLFSASVNDPKKDRYVNPNTVANLGLGATLGIHTLRINSNAKENTFSGIELIAQDTSNRNNIQIPSQDVVSYGKKFTVSGTPHYDPFTTMSYGGSGTTLSALQSLIDTDTSLGMDAWKAGTSNYHRPWNGGRVVKWVDSSGVIKTSVNMMPPNAQNIGTTASNAVSDAHIIAGTNDDTINFNTSAVDHSQAEVAKTFHVKEFGNGSANGGTGATYADATMLTSSADDIAYVMDDGLTSLSAHNAYNNGDASVGITSANKFKYYTFIGTGFAIKQSRTSSTPNENHTITVDGVEVKNNHVFSGTDFVHIAQNLPYGTHVVKILKTNHSLMAHFTDVSFYQPKKPPIPEDAVVLCDYMLMSDFVKQTGTGSDIRGQISKGSRYVSASRDIFYNASGAFRTDLSGTLNAGQIGLRVINSNANPTAKLHFFGTTATFHLEGSNEASVAVTLGGSATSETALDNTSSTHGDALTITDTVDLGLTNTELTWTQDDNLYAIIVDSPIHTSHHYQSFETPFLHELVGGDRNMEQTNLVVSPDGKTWDQVTRDLSYIGKSVLHFSRSNETSSSSTSTWVIDENRGTYNNKNFYNKKHFALSYDRIICLVDGGYCIECYAHYSTGNFKIKVNGVDTAIGHRMDAGYGSVSLSVPLQLKKGDYVQFEGGYSSATSTDMQYHGISIEKL